MPSCALRLPLQPLPLSPLNSLIHSNPHRIQFRAVGAYHLLPSFLSPLPAAQWNNPALCIYFGSEGSQGKLSGLAAATNLVQDDETSTEQKSLKRLCLGNDVIALAASFNEVIALLLSPQAGQGMRDYFIPIPVFQQQREGEEAIFSYSSV